MAGNENSDSQLLAVLNERTMNFTKSLDELVRENRAIGEHMVAALDKHALDDTARFKESTDNASAREIRLRSVENWRWYVLGGIAVAGVLGGFAIAILH
jgi:hypothetical protein